MVSALLTASLVILGLAMLACLFRLLKGPTRSDRVAALDTIGIDVLAMITVLCMLLNTQDFLEVILVIGILTFIGTTALARYIERGVVVEEGERRHDR
ncbi:MULTISPECIES: Na(+)/H(+) antiporter subunit F1 [unclassified Paenibacillus]|uniref:Na(+)/H(+) antiporter subunit F1 n=1 Tax=unclassified Paenibacillus TaxID=185978 RepID=UPI002406669E|nr:MULTISPECIES: Na(+)/H(+) antiporter subunit F1 [unclassified Paenibacillus]MDF9839447.1 multicomponent Na+:H+ antiporter subunit F [Paenibacillus sp. PastF-2]MDF9846027.1 multicomponent Na+:H+ antiporter subunit F [Paenibacillus sp. PastM-2]MDF9852600.1 multicomponent Na+:H+ antiporter subunit F [Paenibacillus sp. PastF-1]MDH6477669.1 multicomponent Na+:H+ antiporter subunit F [Paenibacillus sp. PastH-2]MDH6505409.1 multicomponent Na+:H+ antiporter subunit F [Paenibacillus sp. PastM-3]